LRVDGRNNQRAVLQCDAVRSERSAQSCRRSIRSVQSKQTSLLCERASHSFAQGHCAPILYAAWAEAGAFPVADLKNLRKIDSDLEGHPTPVGFVLTIGTPSRRLASSLALEFHRCRNRFIGPRHRFRERHGLRGQVPGQIGLSRLLRARRWSVRSGYQRLDQPMCLSLPRRMFRG
jgi:hypothetical protein